jgi:hypothetical protein
VSFGASVRGNADAHLSHHRCVRGAISAAIGDGAPHDRTRHTRHGNASLRLVGRNGMQEENTAPPNSLRQWKVLQMVSFFSSLRTTLAIA